MGRHCHRSIMNAFYDQTCHISTTEWHITHHISAGTSPDAYSRYAKSYVHFISKCLEGVNVCVKVWFNKRYDDQDGWSQWTQRVWLNHCSLDVTGWYHCGIRLLSLVLLLTFVWRHYVCMLMFWLITFTTQYVCIYYLMLYSYKRQVTNTVDESQQRSNYNVVALAMLTNHLKWPFFLLQLLFEWNGMNLPHIFLKIYQLQDKADFRMSCLIFLPNGLRGVIIRLFALQWTPSQHLIYFNCSLLLSSVQKVLVQCSMTIFSRHRAVSLYSPPTVEVAVTWQK